MATQHEQAELYTRLQEVLGSEPASTLIRMLPPTGELDTRDDLDRTRVELRSEIGLLRKEMIAFRSEVKRDMSELRTEIKQDTSEFKAEIREQVAASRSELKEELVQLRATMRDYEVAWGFVRTFLTIQAATVIAIVGIVLGIERLA